MKKRLTKKYQTASKLFGKRLSGRYAQTIARRIATYGDYDFAYDNIPVTNKSRKYILCPGYDIGVDFNGDDIETENGFFHLQRVD